MAGGVGAGNTSQSVTPQGGASATPQSVPATMSDDFRGSGAPSMPFGQMMQQLGFGGMGGSSAASPNALYTPPASNQNPMAQRFNDYGSALSPQNMAQIQAMQAAAEQRIAQGDTGLISNQPVSSNPYQSVFASLYGTPTAASTTIAGSAPNQAAVPAQMPAQLPAQPAPAAGIASLHANPVAPRPPVQARQLSTPYRRPRLYR